MRQEQLRSVIADIADPLIHRPDAENTLSLWTEQGRIIALGLPEPDRPVLSLEDHRHPLVHHRHLLIRRCGQNGEGSEGFASEIEATTRSFE
jgi:hypothetical protein